MSRLNLTLYDPLLAGNAPIADVSDLFPQTWRRTIRRRGGYYLGTVELTEQDLTARELKDWFNFGLLRELRERGGGRETWRGAAVKMEYTQHERTLTRDLSEMGNAVRVLYTRIFNQLLSNGSGESGAWAEYGTPATVEQSTVWRTHGVYSIHVVADTGDGARVESGFPITAGIAYTFTGALRILSGNWDVAILRSDTGATLAQFSTIGTTGDLRFSVPIEATNTYSGDVEIVVSALADDSEIYCDEFAFRRTQTPDATGWYEDVKSIAVHGRRELIFLEAGKSDEDANAEAASKVLDLAWPITRRPHNFSTGAPQGQGDQLRIIFAGYWFTLNWLYSILSGTLTASAAVSALAALQSDYVTIGRIDENETEIALDDRGPLRVGDMLRDICGAGETGGARYSVGVYDNRRFEYRLIADELSYYLAGDQVLGVNGGEVEPWAVRPGWALWIDLPIGPGTLTAHPSHDRRWVFLEEVEMLPGGQIVVNEDESA